MDKEEFEFWLRGMVNETVQKGLERIQEGGSEDDRIENLRRLMHFAIDNGAGRSEI
jgi:hypothetical protein